MLKQTHGGPTFYLNRRATCRERREFVSNSLKASQATLDLDGIQRSPFNRGRAESETAKQHHKDGWQYLQSQASQNHAFAFLLPQKMALKLVLQK